MIESIVKPKRPIGDDWSFATWWTMPPAMAARGYPTEPWWNERHGLFALSAVEVIREKPEAERWPEFHISISHTRGRCTRHEAEFVLRAFGLEDATEDNHVPSGKVRNFWRPVADHLSGRECSCVETEPAIREDKGEFVWRPA